MELIAVLKCAYIIVCSALFLSQMITIFADYFAYPVVSSIYEKRSNSLPLPVFSFCAHIIHFTILPRFWHLYPSCLASSFQRQDKTRVTKQCLNNVTQAWTGKERKYFLDSRIPLQK